MTTAKHPTAAIVERVVARQGFRLRMFGRTWWWTQIATNGEPLATSELYSSPAKRDQTGRKVADQLRVPYVVETNERA